MPRARKAARAKKEKIKEPWKSASPSGDPMPPADLIVMPKHLPETARRTRAEYGSFTPANAARFMGVPLALWEMTEIHERAEKEGMYDAEG